jgi:hypothetical protein
MSSKERTVQQRANSTDSGVERQKYRHKLKEVAEDSKPSRRRDARARTLRSRPKWVTSIYRNPIVATVNLLARIGSFPMSMSSSAHIYSEVGAPAN